MLLPWMSQNTAAVRKATETHGNTQKTTLPNVILQMECFEVIQTEFNQVK